MTDFQRCNQVFIRAFFPFVMLALSCADNPESALPAQDVTLKQGETLVVIRRQDENCTLEVLASRADNNAIAAKPQTLMKSESSFILRLNDIIRADAITLWAVCRDDQKRIVEMGNTVIAVPSSASAVRFETKRLPVSGSWYRMNPSRTNWQQNAIWTHSSDKAVVTGNNGKLRFWNGFGWQEKVYASLDCINFVDAVGIEGVSPAIVSGSYNEPKITGCSPTLSFTLNLSSSALVPRMGYDATINSSLSSMGQYPGVSSVYIYSIPSSSVVNYDDIRSDRLWSTQSASPKLDFQVLHKTNYGKTVSISISPFLLKQNIYDQPYPYWILTKHGSAYWLWKYPLITKTTYFEPAMRPDGALEITKMVPSKIVGSRSLAVEATWIVGEGPLQSPPPPPLPPPPPVIPVAIAIPTGIAYATQDLSSQDQPAMLDSNPLNCGKIYTPASDMNTAYVLCSQGLLLNWLLTCRASADGTSVTCQSEKIDLSDRPANEKLVGIDGKGTNQLWLIGDQGGIWLYQK